MRNITDETPVAYDKDGTEIPADRLQTWAYNQLEAAPELAAALRETLGHIERQAFTFEHEDDDPKCKYCGLEYEMKDGETLDYGDPESWTEHHAVDCVVLKARAALAKVTA